MHRVLRTEVFAQNNKAKMELQLETEQQIHFRSVIKLYKLYDPLPKTQWKTATNF